MEKLDSNCRVTNVSKTIRNLGIVYYFHLYTKHCFCVVVRSIGIIPSLYPYKLPNRKRDLFILNAMYEGLATTGVLKRTTTMISILLTVIGNSIINVGLIMKMNV